MNNSLFKVICCFLGIFFYSCTPKPSLEIAYFQVDVTPAIGSPVAYVPARSITDSLDARGVVLLPKNQDAIVLCSVDWLLISNRSMDEFKNYLAKAAGTTPDRVSIHTLHQHDTPWCDASSEEILAQQNLGGIRFDLEFLEDRMKATAAALTAALNDKRPVTAIGFGKANVEKVASNRRILGEDGQVKIVRYSSSRDSAAINAPEGVIDPELKSVSFWHDDQALAVLNYYATHPQSYYGQGDVNPEFIGLARNSVHKKLGVPQVFFIGAAGNVAAGKYNNGSPEMRPVLTQRIADAMEKAFSATKTFQPTTPLQWRSEPLALPLAPYLIEDSLRTRIADTTLNFNDRFTIARQLAWIERNKEGTPLAITALQLGNIWLLHMPGEPFVEYQLKAQEFKGEDPVCTAAYGDGGPIYIGTSVAYQQGGYEVDPRVNMTTTEAEKPMLETIRKVIP